MPEPTTPATETLRQRIEAAFREAGETTYERAPFYETLADALLPLVAAERAEAAREEAAVVQPALDELADYRNRINWETTCCGCARMLDGAVRETERAEAAEAKVSAALALHCEAFCTVCRTPDCDTRRALTGQAGD